MKAKMNFLVAMILSTSSWAANRITAPNDPGTRCSGNIAVEKCAPRTKLALQNGCINQEEYDTLMAYGSFPSCAPDPDTGVMTLISWCKCGCFHPDTRIYSMKTPDADQTSAYGAAKASSIFKRSHSFDLVNLSPFSKLNNLYLSTSTIRTKTSGPEAHPLIVIKTETGETLKVTAKHAVLKANGTMVTANTLKVGDRLVRANGAFTRIKSLTSERTERDVINFALEANDPIEHIMVAEGLFVGDLLWQSSLDDLQNQIIVRQ